MTYYTTVTQKGQITIPKALREFLNIDKYDTVKVFANPQKGILIVEKAPDLVDMAGTLKINKRLLKKYPVENVRELMVGNYGKSEKSRL